MSFSSDSFRFGGLGFSALHFHGFAGLRIRGFGLLGLWAYLYSWLQSLAGSGPYIALIYPLYSLIKPLYNPKGPFQASITWGIWGVLIWLRLRPSVGSDTHSCLFFFGVGLCLFVPVDLCLFSCRVDLCLFSAPSCAMVAFSFSCTSGFLSPGSKTHGLC